MSSAKKDWKNIVRALERSQTDRVLGGVCGGLGKHTPLPSWLWRAIFLGLLFCGVGFLVYLILWLCMPQQRCSDDGMTSATKNDWQKIVRRLARSRTDRILGGVCGGLGEHTALPSWLWRAIFLVLLFGGVGFLAYLILWLCMPQQPYPVPPNDELPYR